MTSVLFPSLALANLPATRDTIQGYSKVLGKIRRALTPPQKHWWHVSLRVNQSGLTTTPIPSAEAEEGYFEMALDFLREHQLVISTNRQERWSLPLTAAPSLHDFCEAVLTALAQLGINVELDRSLFADTTPGVYDPAAAAQVGQALISVNQALNQFKAELTHETGPVQLWPHHFDLAMLWFSGRKVPGVDPADEENADEQMNFGFSTGDSGISEPYFYITAYPWPEQIVSAALPAGASWHTASWKGALFMYNSLVEVAEPTEKLLAYLRATHQAGARLMQ
jgi:hypothetical protein